MAYRSKSGITFTPAAGNDLQAFLVGGTMGAIQGAEKYIDRERAMDLQELKNRGEERRAHIYGQYQVAASAAGRQHLELKAGDWKQFDRKAALAVVRKIRESENKYMGALGAQFDDQKDATLDQLTAKIAGEIATVKARIAQAEKSGEGADPEQEKYLEDLLKLQDLITDALSREDIVDRGTMQDYFELFNEGLDGVFTAYGDERDKVPVGAPIGPAVTPEVTPNGGASAGGGLLQGSPEWLDQQATPFMGPMPPKPPAPPSGPHSFDEFGNIPHEPPSAPEKSNRYDKYRQ